MCWKASAKCPFSWILPLYFSIVMFTNCCSGLLMSQLFKKIKTIHCISASGSVLKIILFVEVCKIGSMKKCTETNAGNFLCTIIVLSFFVVHENVCTFLSLSFMKYNVLKIVLVCFFWDSVEKISLCFVSRQNTRFSRAQYPKVTAKRKDTPVQIHQVRLWCDQALGRQGVFPFFVFIGFQLWVLLVWVTQPFCILFQDRFVLLWNPPMVLPYIGITRMGIEGFIHISPCIK